MRPLQIVFALSLIAGAGCGFRTSLDQPGAVAVTSFTCHPNPTLPGTGFQVVQGETGIACVATLTNTASVAEPFPNLVAQAVVGGNDDSLQYHFTIPTPPPQTIAPGEQRQVQVPLELAVYAPAVPGSGTLTLEAIDPRGPVSFSAPLEMTVLQTAFLKLASQELSGPTCVGLHPASYRGTVQNTGGVRALVSTVSLEISGVPASDFTLTPSGSNPTWVDPGTSAEFRIDALGKVAGTGPFGALLSAAYTDAVTGAAGTLDHGGNAPLSGGVSAISAEVGASWGPGTPTTMTRGGSGYGVELLVHNSSGTSAITVTGAALDMFIGNQST